MDKDQIWQAALGEIELNLSRANFTTWFKNTFISSLDSGRVIVCVPSTFTKTWLEKKYHKDICTALENITSQKVKEIIYKVEAKKDDHNSIFEKVRPNGQKIPADAPSHPHNRFGLNARYAFETFVVGKGNELAHAACQAVAANPGKAYNPLFIYGGVGLGKTHLIQAVGNEISKRTNKILYVTCEKFTNDYIQAIRNGGAKEFKDLYRGVDLLLIDDIQFMGGKDGTQEEFFHTFNELHQSNKQIVITSDRQPKYIPALEKRLLSRFEWGMIADVIAPDLETRIAILEAKCKEKNYNIDHDILAYTANNVQSNIRELEGALNRLIAYHEFNNTKPTLESTKQTLSGILASSAKPVSAKRIIDSVSRFYEVAIKDIVGKSRKKELVKPRQIIMYLMREDLSISYPSIGDELGGRDHTTAIHAYNKICKDIKASSIIKQEIDLIKQLIKDEQPDYSY
jgi:chromosomal replication initiator protein